MRQDDFDLEVVSSPVARRLGRSRSSAHRDQQTGLLPPCFVIGQRVTGYLRREVDAIVAARAVHATDRQIRELVLRLVTERRELGLSILSLNPTVKGLPHKLPGKAIGRPTDAL